MYNKHVHANAHYCDSMLRMFQDGNIHVHHA